ncbi:MAG: toll/interleukin-1 receptor domain-containing protein [Methanophagales archaeon]|jgi:hypothetical protein|nr:toll/interleukin-1 receptor domain-containing protein [Methanophagales archaeon]
MSEHVEKGDRGTLHVFLSYAVADKEYAHKLHKLLSQQPNLHIFTTEALSAGEDWTSKLKDELSKCDVFVVLLSPNAIESSWVLSELGAAWALDKLIIPVVTELKVSSKIPVQLKGTHFVEIEHLEKHPEAINQALMRYKKTGVVA